MSEKKWRANNFCLVLYPEDETHTNAVLRELDRHGFNYAYCLHNRDTWRADDKDNTTGHVDGEPKKEHWHVVICCKNARWNTGIAKCLGVKDNYIELCESRDGALAYLVHARNPEKAQYDVSEVVGPLTPLVQAIVDGKNDDNYVDEILNYLDSYDGPVSLRTLIRWCCSNGLWGYARQMGGLLTRCVDEHNSSYDFSCPPSSGYYERAKSVAGFKSFVEGFEYNNL